LTREEKIKKRQARAFVRKGKRIAKDKDYLNTAALYDRGYSMSWGRRKQHGSAFSCEMGYGGCEERGYCNGDC
jgi:hypothetical protein